MDKKLNPIVSLVLVLMPLFILAGLIFYSNQNTSFTEKNKAYTVFERVEIVSGESIPFSKQFRQLGINIRYSTGETLQEDIFVTPSGLMSNWKANDIEIRNSNNQSLIGFSEKANEEDTSVYFAILPTASGVIQKKLPQFSNRVNQRNIIENSYNQLTGKLTSVNVYNTLSENQDKYVFHRTDDSLTSLGGYYVYRELTRRLLTESDIIPLASFDINYKSDYYGNLYDKVPYYKVKGDTLGFYKYKKKGNYMLEVYKSEDKLVYDSLYPDFLGINQYIGGAHYLTKLYNDAAGEAELLVIGDSTAASYLPFMINNYSMITFINIYDENIDFNKVNIKDYNQILIGIGIENYTNNLGITDFLAKLAYN